MAKKNSSKTRFLKRSFFDRKTEDVARNLLGKILCKKEGKLLLKGRIVETEAYLGEHDPAAHAYSGRTKRTDVLYGQSGHAYVFKLRKYHCLNVVAEKENSPGCVLIRALEPLEGMNTMMKRRYGVKKDDVVNLCNGPGKLYQSFNITLDNYGCDLITSKSELYLIDADKKKKVDVTVTPRVGINKASDWNQRYIVKSNPFVSNYKF